MTANIITTVSQPNWLQPNFDNMLPELIEKPNWVLTKPVLREGKWTKPPLQANKKFASVTDSTTWTDFETVQTAYESGDFIGVGFVLDGKPHFNGKYLHGFDWDHCVENRQIDPEVEAVLKELRIPRLEFSISGTGLRGFFLHDEPLKSCRTNIQTRSVELYSDKRYLTTTGIGQGVLS